MKALLGLQRPNLAIPHELFVYTQSWSGIVLYKGPCNFITKTLANVL